MNRLNNEEKIDEIVKYHHELLMDAIKFGFIASFFMVLLLFITDKLLKLDEVSILIIMMMFVFCCFCLIGYKVYKDHQEGYRRKGI